MLSSVRERTKSQAVQDEGNGTAGLHYESRHTRNHSYPQ